MKNKFKVGDIVKVTGEGSKNYKITNSCMKKAAVIDTNCEFTFTNWDMMIKILEHDNTDYVGDTYYVNSDDFELVKSETIVIYRKDDKVYALDKQTGEKVCAKCHPDDKFDFKKGAEIAFNRLMGNEPEKPKEEYYNGKIVCVGDIEGNESAYTLGKIYQVKDGRFTDNRGVTVPDTWFKPLKSFDELMKYSCSKWLEVVD